MRRSVLRPGSVLAGLVVAAFSVAGCGGGEGGGASGTGGVSGSRDAGSGAGAGGSPITGGGGAIDAGSSAVMSDAAASAVDAGPPVTWHGDVAAIVARRCSACHQAGGIGPFSLTDFASAQRFAAAMSGAVMSGRMPPWQATDTEQCHPRFGWKDDMRLSADEKSIIARWAAQGAPEGQPTPGVEIAAPASLALSNPSNRTTMPKPYTVEGKTDQFRCFPLPYEFAQNSWITGLQVVPGNAKVVHHVLVWLDSSHQSDALVGPDGSYPCFGAPGFATTLLGAWAPGAVPNEMPPATGLAIPKGARIVINVHYHPTTTPETDATSIDLRWTTTRTPYTALLALPGNAKNASEGLMPGADDPASGPAFVIPANVSDHEERAEIKVASVPISVRIFTVGTHMHYVGTGMRMEIDRSGRVGGAPSDEPTRECLVETPKWDFHWQRGYSYDAPLGSLPTVMSGDKLLLRCLYDNSTRNPYVMEALREQGLRAPQDVRLGEQTLDEMCLGVIGVAFPSLGL
jgi:hypothetical protein